MEFTENQEKIIKSNVVKISDYRKDAPRDDADQLMTYYENLIALERKVYYNKINYLIDHLKDELTRKIKHKVTAKKNQMFLHVFLFTAWLNMIFHYVLK